MVIWTISFYGLTTERRRFQRIYGVYQEAEKTAAKRRPAVVRAKKLYRVFLPHGRAARPYRVDSINSIL
jgi:hypothetical protein